MTTAHSAPYFFLSSASRRQRRQVLSVANKCRTLRWQRSLRFGRGGVLHFLPGGVSRGMPTQVRRAILFQRQNVLNYLCQSVKIFSSLNGNMRALQSSAISYTATCGNSSAVVGHPSATWLKPGRERGCQSSCTFPVQASRGGDGKVTGLLAPLRARSSCRDRVCLAQFRYSFNPCLQHH